MPWTTNILGMPVPAEESDYSPWIYGAGLRIGPITRNEEERLKAMERYKQLQKRRVHDPVWEATKEGLTDIYQSASDWAYRNLTHKGAAEERSRDAQFRYDEGRGIRPMPGSQEEVAAPPVIGGVRQVPNEPVSIPQWVKDMHGYVSGVGHVAKDTLPDLIPGMTAGMYGRNAVGLTQGEEEPTVADVPGSVPSVPAPVATAVEPPASGPAAVVAPEEEGADNVSTIQQYLDVVREFMPAPPEDNSYQDKADAFAKQEGERTRLLAQLAFAAGLTKAGGKRFEGIAEGFGAAAGVYSQGFNRYQRALQDSADRFADTKETRHRTDVAQRGAALKLYTDAQSDARDRAEKRHEKLQASLDTRYKAELDAAKGDLGTDPAVVQEIFKRWEMAKQQGSYIPPIDDVSDE